MAKRKVAQNEGGSLATKTELEYRHKSPITRTTIVLPASVDANLELYALQTNIPKGEVVKRVLEDFLRRKGLQPDKLPREISVEY